ELHTWNKTVNEAWSPGRGGDGSGFCLCRVMIVVATRMETLKVSIRELDNLGKGALERGDYQEALKWFNMAFILQPDDVTLLENHTYILLKPDSPRAHCMKDVAWMLLKNFLQACKSYKSTIHLDPYTIEIKKLFSIAAKGFLLGLAEQILIRTVTFLPKLVPNCEFFLTLLELANENPMEAMDLLRQFFDGHEFLFLNKILHLEILLTLGVVSLLFVSIFMIALVLRRISLSV
ncbi:stress-induced-phosphoprotein 1, partial [Striga asiatica]